MIPYPSPGTTYSTLSDFLLKTREITKLNYPNHQNGAEQNVNLRIQRNSNSIMILNCSFGKKRIDRMTREDKLKKESDWCSFIISAERFTPDSTHLTQSRYRISNSLYQVQHNHSSASTSSSSTTVTNSKHDNLVKKRLRSNSNPSNIQFNSRSEDAKFLPSSTSQQFFPLNPISPTSPVFLPRLLPHTYPQQNQQNSIETESTDELEFKIPVIQRKTKLHKRIRPSTNLSITTEYKEWMNVLGMKEGEELQNWKGNEGLSYRNLFSTQLPVLASAPQLQLQSPPSLTIESLPAPVKIIRKRRSSTSRTQPSNASKSTTRNSTKLQVEEIGFELPFLMLNYDNVATSMLEYNMSECGGGGSRREKRSRKSMEVESCFGDDEVVREEVESPDTSFERNADVDEGECIGLGLVFEDNEEENEGSLGSSSILQRNKEVQFKQESKDQLLPINIFTTNYNTIHY